MDSTNLEAAHVVDAVAVVGLEVGAAPGAATLALAGALLQVLLVVLEVVDRRWRPDHGLPGPGQPAVLALLQEGVRVEDFGHQEARPPGGGQAATVQVVAPRLPAVEYFRGELGFTRCGVNATG